MSLNHEGHHITFFTINLTNRLLDVILMLEHCAVTQEAINL